MLYKRHYYLQKLIDKQNNGLIKILTGVRRCGKSTLLFKIFAEYLISEKISNNNIIKIDLESESCASLRDPSLLSDYVYSVCKNKKKKYYILIDEIQYAITKRELKNPDIPVRIYSVLNGFLSEENFDVYVTGSNSKLLSKDVSTEFRGRGDVIHINPLSFEEYYNASGLYKRDAYDNYIVYGGMPYILHLNDEEDKFKYLNHLVEEIFLKDISERYRIKHFNILKDLTNFLFSNIGSLTTPTSLAKSIKADKKINIAQETVANYLDYLESSFLFSKAQRFDVKGKRYFNYPSKYYCCDVGLRNVALGMRQQEESHIVENLIYNHLIIQGFNVDVGVVNVTESNGNGKRNSKDLEIDFIAQKGFEKYYIQVALFLNDDEKTRKELRPLLAVNDSFQKILISNSYGKPWIDENGVIRMSIIDFLLGKSNNIVYTKIDIR